LLPELRKIKNLWLTKEVKMQTLTDTLQHIFQVRLGYLQRTIEASSRQGFGWHYDCENLQPCGIRVGWLISNHIYLDPTALFGVLEQKSGGRVLQKHWAVRGEIVTGNQSTVQKRINGKKYRVLELTTDAVQEILSGQLETASQPVPIPDSSVPILSENRDTDKSPLDVQTNQSQGNSEQEPVLCTALETGSCLPPVPVFVGTVPILPNNRGGITPKILAVLEQVRGQAPTAQTWELESLAAFYTIWGNAKDLQRLEGLCCDCMR
jgi:hypothetical protein